MGSFDALFNVAAVAVSVFLVTLLGAYLRKKEKLSDEADSKLLWLAINILYPALIVNAVLQNPALDNLENIFLPPVMGFSSVLIGLGLGLLFRRFSRLESDKERRSFLLANGINNYGFLPIALIVALYDRATLGVLFVHNIGVDLAIWSIGILVLTSHTSLISSLKNLCNAPLCAIAGCLFLTYFGLDDHLPSFVFKTTALLGQATIPMSLLLVGSLMYDAQKSCVVKDGIRIAISACAIRLVLFPICYLALVWLLPMTLELKRVMLVEAAQPAAMLPIVLCKRYHSSPQIAYIILLATSLASIVTMPLWIHFGSQFIAI